MPFLMSHILKALQYLLPILFVSITFDREKLSVYCNINYF